MSVRKPPKAGSLGLAFARRGLEVALWAKDGTVQARSAEIGRKDTEDTGGVCSRTELDISSFESLAFP